MLISPKRPGPGRVWRDKHAPGRAGSGRVGPGRVGPGRAGLVGPGRDGGARRGRAGPAGGPPLGPPFLSRRCHRRSTAQSPGCIRRQTRAPASLLAGAVLGDISTAERALHSHERTRPPPSAQSSPAAVPARARRRAWSRARRPAGNPPHDTFAGRSSCSCDRSRTSISASRSWRRSLRAPSESAGRRPDPAGDRIRGGPPPAGGRTRGGLRPTPPALVS
jgi:hypothetical protein